MLLDDGIAKPILLGNLNHRPAYQDLGLDLSSVEISGQENLRALKNMYQHFTTFVNEKNDIRIG